MLFHCHLRTLHKSTSFATCYQHHIDPSIQLSLLQKSKARIACTTSVAYWEEACVQLIDLEGHLCFIDT